MSKSARLQLPDPTFSHLPLVVEGAPTLRTRLILATQVQAQILKRVVRWVAVHMIDHFLRREDTPKMFSHNPTMLKDVVPLAAHGIEPVKLIVGHSVLGQGDVTRAGDTPSSGITAAAKGSGFRLGSVATETDPGKTGTLHLLSQGTHGPRPNRSTDRTFDTDSGSHRSVHPQRGYLGLIHGRMVWERCQVHWSRHSCNHTLETAEA